MDDAVAIRQNVLRPSVSPRLVPLVVVDELEVNLRTLADALHDISREGLAAVHQTTLTGKA